MWSRALILVVLLACGKKEPAGPTKEQKVAEQKQTLAPVIEKNRAATAKFLSGIRAIGQDAKPAPPVTAPAALPAGTKLERATTLIGTPSWFAGDKEPTYSDFKDKANMFINPVLHREAMQRLLDTGIWNAEVGYELSTVEDTFADATRFAHAAAVRIHTYAPADARGQTFTPATASGDVLVYTLPDGKRIGAFPFEVVQKETSISARDVSDADKELGKAFRDELDKAINDELTAYVQGKGGAAAPGVAAEANLKGFVEKLNSKYPRWAFDNNLLASATATIEAGPTVVFKTDNVKNLEAHRAPLAAFVEKTLGTPATIRIEAQ